MSLYDLHLHSTASDGQMRPEDLVRYAAKQGIVALAISDHDSIDGLEEAAAAALALGLDLIPAVELSVDFSPGEMHILGYGVNPVEALLSYLEARIRSRNERNDRIVEALSVLGFPLTMEEILAEAMKQDAPGEHVTVGRPHVAAAMVTKGYVENITEAFDRYLGKGCPAYVERETSHIATPERTIQVIHEAGGVAVLAHPVVLGVEGDDLEQLIIELKAYGLDGVEAMHSDHDLDLQQQYRLLADRHGLFITGGSDFHGPKLHPDIHIGIGRSNLVLDDPEVVTVLKSAIARHRGGH